ncbi:MAG: DNA-3-methyladenine glycosylase I [Ktedonobacterales bacterium]
MTEEKKTRCAWAESHELFIPYHDTEWGVPVHDDRLLFEMLSLEGAQAGLNWLAILKRRPQYREAFDHFRAEIIVNYDAAKRAALLQNEGIIRNRLKIDAVVENACAFLAIQHEYGSFDAYIWRFVGGKPLLGTEKLDAPAKSELMSKDLKKHGFRFVGPTICYAFMQAVGMVNDHDAGCFRAEMLS